jgi:hypothetical protein
MFADLTQSRYTPQCSFFAALRRILNLAPFTCSLQSLRSMGSWFSAPLPFEQRLRNALYNKDRDLVTSLLADSNLKVSQLPIEIYVEVAQRHWNWNVVQHLCVDATVANMVALLSASVLAGETYPYQAIFDSLEQAATREGTTMESVLTNSSLKHLFIVACHKQDETMIDAFLDHGCFVATDSAALRLVFRREMIKKSAGLVSGRLTRRILCTHEKQHDVVKALRSECDGVKLTDSHKELLAALDEYLNGGFDKGDAGRLCGSPTYQRKVRAVVHSLKNQLSDESMKDVASFIEKQ